jgi:hypothetical protein
MGDPKSSLVLPSELKIIYISWDKKVWILSSDQYHKSYQDYVIVSRAIADLWKYLYLKE